MTYSVACSGCFSSFILPMYDSEMKSKSIRFATNEFTITCVCGTENRYPLMAVLPFPLKAEVSVA